MGNLGIILSLYLLVGNEEGANIRAEISKNESNAAPSASMRPLQDPRITSWEENNQKTAH